MYASPSRHTPVTGTRRARARKIKKGRPVLSGPPFTGGAGGELDARVQSEIGVEFYRHSRSLGSYSLTCARQSASEPAAGSYFATATVLRSQPRGGLQPDQATKPCLEGRRGFLGREERRLPACNRAQGRIAEVGALRNSNKVASYFWRYFFTRRSTILGLLSSASLLCRYHSAPRGRNT